ncbi:hypothetical protein Zmor_018223 [Zophobas morio]|uniref:Odorant receptor n=1 Tax=Zophobas morio TaxID=2755281 RepID=A0AA38IDZ8_9CUCU|nr:hypothetical protein Zmor_018223 [Zophobas morio]
MRATLTRHFLECRRSCIQCILVKRMKTDDHLKLCHFFSVGIFQLKTVRLLLGLSKRFELDYFVQYGPMYFISVYTLVCIITQSYITSIITRYLHHTKIWTIENAPKEIREQVKKIGLYVTLYMITAICMALLAAASFAVSTDSDNEFLYPYKLCEQYFPSFKTMFIFLFKLGLFVMAYASASIPAFGVVYYYAELVLQKYMLIYSIQEINANYQKRVYISLDNKQYHVAVSQKLKIVIKNHIILNKYGRQALEKCQMFVFLFQISGIVAMASVVVFYFTFSGSLTDQYLRIIALMLLSFLTVIGLAVSGQTIEDISEELTDALVKVEWYHWNEINKMKYLIFLTNTSKVLTMKFSENISLNLRLGLQISKAFFTAVSIMYRLRLSRDV